MNMKKHRNRIICFAAIIALMVSMSGCSASSDFAAGVNDIADVEVEEGAAEEKTEGKTTSVAEKYDGYAEDMTMAMDEGGEADTIGKDAAQTPDPSEPESDKDEKINIPDAGQLTAGEWNDNDNWGFFSNLVNAGTISFPSYGVDPRYRTAVTLTSEDGSPIANAQVRLVDDSGNVLWSAVSDKRGRAYLFALSDGKPTSIEVESDGKKQNFEINTQSGDSQGVNETESNEMELIFDGKGTAYKQTDIMFIMDATGSMSDEMLFLQSEFSAITDEIGTENTRYSVNFYRDEGEEYVTKCNDFTSDVKELQQKLNGEKAENGGDTPEAVADILEKTMFESNWDEESVKLAFLIFDAPPHEGTEETITAAVKKAAERGIHIIPVVSSNSDRDTELFARALAINTGSTYVFLTDDSGIGDSHLEPIIGSYDVEKLFDIIVRIVNDYRQ